MYATKSAPPPAMSAAGVSSQSSHVNAQGNYSIIVLQSHEYYHSKYFNLLSYIKRTIGAYNDEKMLIELIADPNSVRIENCSQNVNVSSEVHSQSQYIIHQSHMDGHLSSIPSTSIPLPTVPASSAAAALLAATSPSTSNLANNQQQGNK